MLGLGIYDLRGALVMALVIGREHDVQIKNIYIYIRRSCFCNDFFDMTHHEFFFKVQKQAMSLTSLQEQQAAESALRKWRSGSKPKSF